MSKIAKTRWVITGIIVVLLLGAAGAYYYWGSADKTVVVAPAQTAKVRIGDLVITASGAGNVIPRMQADLGFRTSGILKDVNIVVGQSVTEGQVLASLEDALQKAQLAQADAAFQSLFSEASRAQSKITLANAEIAYQADVEELQYAISPDVYFREIELEKSNQVLLALNKDPNATEKQKTDAQKNYEHAQTNLSAAQERYRVEYVPGTFTTTYIAFHSLKWF